MAQSKQQPRAARWSAAEARRVLAEMESSGMSVQRFARERRVGADRLYRWRRRLRRARAAGVAAQRVSPPRFTEVTIRPNDPSATIEIDLPGGVAVRVMGETRVEDAVTILSRLPMR